MRLFDRTIARAHAMGCIAALGFAAFGQVAAHAQEAATIALTDAAIIGTDSGAIENGVIVIRGDTIACVGARGDCAIPADAEMRDMSGRFITPGLVDAHVHLGLTGWLDARPDSVKAPDIYPYDETVAALRADPGRWHRAYLCSGVTAVFDVGGSEWTVTGPQATDTDRADRVHVAAAGPLITPLVGANDAFTPGSLADQPIFLPFETDQDVQDGIASLKAMGARAVKVWFIAVPDDRRPEMEQRLMLAGRLAREAGLPLVVHATDLRSATLALRAGASVLAHSVDDAPLSQEFLDLLVGQDAIYVPTLLIMENWIKAISFARFGVVPDVDDPGRCVDQPLLNRMGEIERLAPAVATRTPEGQFDRLIREGQNKAMNARNLRAVRDAGGRIAAGTDAGNPLTLHGPGMLHELEAMQSAGMTPDEIIEAATLHGAQSMGMADRIGSITVGKQADLIVLDADPREDARNFRSLSFVMRKGVLRSQEELRLR